MNKNIFTSAFLVIAIVFSIAGCSSNIGTTDISSKEETAVMVSSKDEMVNTSVSPIIDENKTRYISTSLDRLKKYSDFKSLQTAPYVFTGICTSTQPVFQNDSLYTLSKIKLTEVFKGALNVGDTISVVELGGRTTFGEYTKGCNITPKSFEVGDERLPDDYNVVVGTDGFFTLEKDDEVLLFAGDTSGFLKGFDEPLFDVFGAYDGKLYPVSEDIFSRTSPSSLAKQIFGENTLKISREDLITLK